MQFIDLKSQQELIREKVEKRLKDVLDHGRYIMGPEVAELEEQLAQYVGVKHCIAVASGTDALMIALMALDIKAGDEVITSPFTFIATAEVIALLGAKPVYVDIDPATQNIDSTLIESAITAKTKAIMPVSLYGQCADFDSINAIAAKYNLPVIEDGAQSFGATYKGTKSCGLSTIGCTSFFPSKPLGCYGDGGACFTNDDLLATKMKQIRVHGQERRYHHTLIGINGRMDTVQAAILLEKLAIFPREVEQRSACAKVYTELIQNHDDSHLVNVPFVKEGNTSVFAQYTVQVNEREKVITAMQEDGIPTAVHYPVPLHKQPALADEKVSCPVSEKISEKVMSLPMHPYLKREEQVKVIDALLRAIGGK